MRLRAARRRRGSSAQPRRLCRRGGEAVESFSFLIADQRWEWSDEVARMVHEVARLHFLTSGMVNSPWTSF
jgi:hypothetical protein